MLHPVLSMFIIIAVVVLYHAVALAFFGEENER